MGSSSRHTGMQQTAAESALLARQAELAFHVWLFLGGVYTQEWFALVGFSPLKVIH